MDGYVDLRTRLKDMDNKEKVKHIWEYYKFPIIGTIIGVIVITTFVSSILSSKKSVLNVVVYDGYVNTQKADNLGLKLKKSVLKNTNSKEKIDIQSIMLKGDNPQLQVAGSEKFFAMVSSRDIDLVLMPKSVFETFSGEKLFKKINGKLVKELGIPQNKLIKYENLKDNTKYSYGIDISGNKKLSTIGYYSKDQFIGIVANVKHLKNTKRFIKWMIK